MKTRLPSETLFKLSLRQGEWNNSKMYFPTCLFDVLTFWPFFTPANNGLGGCDLASSIENIRDIVTVILFASSPSSSIKVTNRMKILLYHVPFLIIHIYPMQLISWMHRFLDIFYFIKTLIILCVHLHILLFSLKNTLPFLLLQTG